MTRQMPRTVVRFTVRRGRGGMTGVGMAGVGTGDASGGTCGRNETGHDPVCPVGGHAKRGISWGLGEM